MAVDLTSKDRREQIMTLLGDLLGAITNGSQAIQVFRDRGELDQPSRGSFVLLDGKEELVTQIRGQSMTNTPAAVFRLTPEIWYVAKARDDTTNLTLDGVSAPIGPELSAVRLSVIKTLLTDPNLEALLGPNGQVAYLGCNTDMQSGSTIEGQLQLLFSFDYVLDPRKL